MAIKQRSRRRPQPRRSSFQRRLSWREVEAAFDHLFDYGLDDPESKHIVGRFKRARAQMLPIFGGMVVSPYERERLLAFGVLEQIGGQATVKVLDEILEDSDIHPPYKLDLRGLRATLDPDNRASSRSRLALADDDDDEDLDDDECVARETDETDETDDASAEPADRQAEEPRRGQRRSRRGRDRSRRRADDSTAAAAATTETTDEAAAAKLGPELFDKPQDAFLEVLAGPTEPVLAALMELPERKRLSFVDRVGRLRDERLVAFLTALLTTDDWGLVQSALRAIGDLGSASALPAVEQLAADTSRKRVRMRAERVRDQLRKLAEGEAVEATDEIPDTPPTEPTERPAGPAPKPKASQTTDTDSGEPDARKPRPSRSRSRSRRRAGESAPEPEPTPEAAEEPAVAASEPAPEPEPKAPPAPAQSAAALGVVRPAPAEPVASVIAEEWRLPLRLPKLLGCLASGIDCHGRQRLLAFRADGRHHASRLEVWLDDQLGWLALSWSRGLPETAMQDELAAVAAAGGVLVEVTAAYLRGRLDEARERSQTVGQPLPAEHDKALKFVGRSRAAAPATTPEPADQIGQEAVEELLDHPLFRTWGVTLTERGKAMGRWLGTRGKRSASRIRRRLIDEVAEAWSSEIGSELLRERLLRQAQLLDRLDRADLAAVALRAAADLAPERLGDNLVVREMVYRGFNAGVERQRADRNRRRSQRVAREARERQARSLFQQNLRRRRR